MEKDSLFSKWYWENRIVTCRRMKWDRLPTIHKNELKMDERATCETENHHNPRGENRQQPLDLSHSNILIDMFQERKETKAKNKNKTNKQKQNSWDLIKIKKASARQWKQPTKLVESEKVFAKDISDKALVYNICEELPDSTPKKQRIQGRNGQKTRTDVFPKKTTRWLTDTWKEAQQQSSSGKYKSKAEWDTTSHLSAWLKLTTQVTIDVGEDAEKGERFCPVGGNAN